MTADTLPAGGSAVTAGLELIRCASTPELEPARAFRDETFLRRRNLVIEDGLEARRDSESHVFMLRQEAETVASIRSQPYPSELSPLSALCGRTVRWSADSEVGRMTAARAPGRRAYPLLTLTLGAMWMLERTRHRRYVAHCHPSLFRIYRMVGAEDTALKVALPGRDELHCIVLGTYEDAAGRGRKLLGLSEAQARAAIRWDRDGMSEIDVASRESA